MTTVEKADLASSGAVEVTADTTISELLDTYPFLVDFLIAYNPRYGLLKNKVMRATVGKMATLEQVAGIGDVPVETLTRDIAAQIEMRAGDGKESDAEAARESSADEQKLATLKEIIHDLHEGAPLEDVKERFDELIVDVGPMEIAALEDQLIKEGVPVEEVQRLADLHVSVFKEALDARDIPDVPAGHPVHTFLVENELLTDAGGDMDLLLEQLQIDDTVGKLNELREPLQDALDRLSRVEIHYQRKENQLFPYLEKHGLTGVPQVMWGRDDQIRAQLKRAREAFEGQDVGALIELGRASTQSIVDMVYKENHILFPLSLDTLDESEWVDIRKGEGDIGYAFGEPAGDWPESAGAPGVAAGVEEALEETDRLELDTGKLILSQINLMLKHLPIDITFVDENDQVQYFSAGKERIFPRSPGIIGRYVQKCHPPRSLETVDRIVGAFKAGTRDEAGFWIQVRGRTIYIRYFAVRDDDGTFRGTLEVSQDITEIKSIEGERRLLDWSGQ
jgi:PAS domain S-box-containing protein